jgi:hypothetical protein
VPDLILAIVDKGAIIRRMLELRPVFLTQVMHELAGTDDVIAVVAEMLHEGFGILQDRVLKPLLEEEIVRVVGIYAS